MEQLLLYTDVDQGIQDGMGGEYPSTSQRLRAINDELKALKSKFDIMTARRKVAVSVITDGTTAYDLSSLVTDDDVKTVVDIRSNDSDDDQWKPEFTEIAYDDFYSKATNEIQNNLFTVYFEDGIQYINLLRIDPSSTVETMNLFYLSNALGIDNAGDFMEKILGASTDKIILNARHKDLIVLGAMKRLWYQATGDDSQTQLAITRNRYTAELKKLGLSSESKMIQRETRKVKMRNPVA